MKTTKIFFSLAIAILVSLSQAIADDVDISNGDWVGVGYNIKGNWKIVQRDSDKYIIFDESFKTKSGPDLKVYLSTKPIADLQDKTVEKTSVKIAPLQSNKGMQEYKIPEDINLEDFSSLVVHCEAYSHLWGGGDLKQQ